ncbi:MAG: outer membrane beta-barrel protein [Schleiferiaceae bacterium]|nr:outer membrane beta-barrel protein [Schleiferiaceae bacterium]
MKYTFVAISVVVACLTAKGQLNQGGWVLSGAIGGSYTSSEFENDFGGGPSTINPVARSFNLNMAAGYFIIDHLAVGLTSGYTFSGNKTENENSTDRSFSHSYSIGGFARHYVPITKKLAFSTQLGTFYRSGSSKSENIASGTRTTTNEGTSTIVQVTINPGFTYFISDRIGLNANFGQLAYTHENHEIKQTQGTQRRTVNRADVVFGLHSLSFGLSVFLN